MTYDELLQLDSFSQAEVIVPEKQRKHLIKGAHIVETINVTEAVKAGDLVFISGACFHNVHQDLLSMIKILSKKHVSGIVVEIGPYIKQILEEHIALAEELGIPFITLPYEVSVADAISEIYYALFRSQDRLDAGTIFMKEILYGDEQKAMMLLKEFNYVATRQHMVIYLSFDDADFDQRLIAALAKAVPINLSLSLYSVVYAEDEGVIIVLELSQREPVKAIVKRILTSVQKSMQKNLNGNSISAGVSSIFYEPEKIKNAIIESKKAFRVLKGCKARHSARYYEEIGIYRFFFDLGDDEKLRSYIDENIGELITYDTDNHTELVKTLEIDLEEDCNIQETAERMYIHRNTVKYRITRIQEILQSDLNNVNVCFNLRFCYKVRKYLGENQ